MNILQKYKELSNEDKANLIIYCIYDSIYDVAKNNDVVITDDVVEDMAELAYDLYLSDEYYNFSQSIIGDFLAKCYIHDNNFLKMVEDVEYNDILDALDRDDYTFFEQDYELER